MVQTAKHTSNKIKQDSASILLQALCYILVGIFALLCPSPLC